MERLLRRIVIQRIAPDIGEGHETLQTVAEAADAFNSELEHAGSVPFLSASGLDISGLTAMNGCLTDVGPAAWDLSRLRAEPTQEPDLSAAGAR
jgi:hypothetical protein